MREPGAICARLPLTWLKLGSVPPLYFVGSGVLPPLRSNGAWAEVCHDKFEKADCSYTKFLETSKRILFFRLTIFALPKSNTLPDGEPSANETIRAATVSMMPLFSSA